MKKTLFLKWLIMLGCVTLYVGCKNKQSTSQATQEVPKESEKKTGQAFIADDGSTPNILQIAIKSKDHTTLVAAVKAAGLENSLVNAGPLTVFAPTNEAFDALPKGTVETLLKPENKQKLEIILQHHVTPGRYDKDLIKRLKHLGQASNLDVPVTVKDGEVYVGGAKIIASIPAGNGIIHVVDKVILPKDVSNEK